MRRPRFYFELRKHRSDSNRRSWKINEVCIAEYGFVNVVGKKKIIGVGVWKLIIISSITTSEHIDQSKILLQNFQQLFDISSIFQTNFGRISKFWWISNFCVTRQHFINLFHHNGLFMSFRSTLARKKETIIHSDVQVVNSYYNFQSIKNNALQNLQTSPKIKKSFLKKQEALWVKLMKAFRRFTVKSARFSKDVFYLESSMLCGVHPFSLWKQDTRKSLLISSFLQKEKWFESANRREPNKALWGVYEKRAAKNQEKHVSTEFGKRKHFSLFSHYAENITTQLAWKNSAVVAHKTFLFYFSSNTTI